MTTSGNPLFFRADMIAWRLVELTMMMMMMKDEMVMNDEMVIG
jgi:hypothetical protein